MNSSSERITSVPGPPPILPGGGEPSREPRFRLEYTLDFQDYEALFHYTTRISPHVGRHRRWRYAAGFVGICLFVIMCWVTELNTEKKTLSRLIADVVTFLLILLFILALGLTLKKFQSYRALLALHNDPRLFGPTELTLAPEAIWTSDSCGSHTLHWHSILEIVEYGKHVFFFAAETETLILPTRVFPDDSQARDFTAAARRYHAEARCFVKPEGWA
jgi:hypothetical protein